MIIGITGTNGSGKGTVVDYLIREKGFAHYSVRAFLVKELERRGLSIDRTHMRLVGNELRKSGKSMIPTLYEQAIQDGDQNAVIESVRNVGEAEFLKSKDVRIIAVDADQKLRYTRIQKRRSATDQVDFPTFVMHEEREMHPEGPHDMDVRGVIALADYTIQNNGTLDELHREVDNFLTKFK